MLAIIATGLGIPADVQKRLIPSNSTLWNAAVDMYSLNMLMVGDVVGSAEHISAGVDSSNKGAKDLQAAVFHTSTRERPLFAGQRQRTAKDGKGWADAFEDIVNDINEIASAAGPAYQHATAAEFNIASFASGKNGDGFMTDHCQIETKGIDELEARIRVWATENIRHFSEQTEEEKNSFCYVARGFCFQHKADNIAKAGKESFKKFRTLTKTLDAKRTKELSFSSGITFCWCAHKCLGMPNSVATDLNLHYDFVLWLKKQGRENELTVVKSLGPLVGDRFWAVYKNAALIYYLRNAIMEFMDVRTYVARGSQKPENNLAATIRSMSCLLLKPEEVEINQNFVLAEIRTMAAWQYAVMNPLLLVAASIKKVNDQRKYLQELQVFLEKVICEREFARKLITQRGHNLPFTFLADSDFKELYKGQSAGHRLAYEAVCTSQASDDLTLDMIQFSASYMAQKQLNMSADMILEDFADAEFPSKPADNIAAERWFGFVDWRRKMAHHENLIRADGILCWNLNEVSEWLAEKPQAEQDRLINLVSTVNFRSKMMAKQRLRKEAADEASRERAQLLEALGMAKVDQLAAILALQDMWTAGEVDDRLQNMDRAPEKLAAMKAQWNHVKEWCKKAGVKFPFDRQPKGSSVTTWSNALVILLSKDIINTQVRGTREALKEIINGESKTCVQVVEEGLPADKQYIPQSPITLLRWCNEVMAKADSNKDRSRLHRAQRLAAAQVAEQRDHGVQEQVLEGDEHEDEEEEEGDMEDDERGVENGDAEIERMILWSDAAPLD